MKVKVCLYALVALTCAAVLVPSCSEPQERSTSRPVDPSAGRGAATTLPAAATQPAAPTPDISSLKITGPQAHANLSVFIIHGEDRIKDTEFLTLSEAMEAKKIVIHETGDVGELSVENTGDLPVYIQSGDIVKGGRQDRMLPYDYVIAPGSGRKPISSFCVESGRWSRRGGESAVQFSVSMNSAPARVLLAGKLKNDQGAVWANAIRVEHGLSSNVGVTVADSRSASSLQLALESPKLKETAQPYKTKLAGLLEGQDDAIGYAVAINGEVTDVHVFACRALLTKLWPKLLETSAFEAIAVLDRQPKTPARLTAEDVRKFVAAIDKAREQQRRINADMMMRVRTGSAGSAFSAFDGRLGASIHDSYHKNPEPTTKPSE